MKTQEEYYQELVKTIITRDNYIQMLITNFNKDIPFLKRLAIEEFASNWANDLESFPIS